MSADEAIKKGYEVASTAKSTGTYKSVLVNRNDGKGFVKDFMNNAEIKAAKDAKFEVKDDKDTTSSASGPNDYQVPTNKIEEFKTEFPNIAIGKNGVVLLTNEQFIDAQKIVLPYDKNDSVNEAKTQVGKLFSDLSDHKVGSDAYNAIMVEIKALENKGTWDKDRFSGEKDLRAEWNKVNYPYAEIRANYNKLKAALEPDRNDKGEIIESEKKGVGDMAAVFLFMKMLDPGSVVRESEFQAAQATAGAIDQLGIKIAQLKEGDILSPEQRKDFLKLAKDFMEAGTEVKNERRLALGTAVKNYGLNPANVFGVELAPASFYLNSGAYKVANAKGVTLDAMWEGMSEAERNAYLPSAGGN
jgi:predicted  nucleic acid-binding Zn-ribbon protein